MLKKRDLLDCYPLFSLMKHPDVFPFVRHKAQSIDEFLFMTKQLIEAEEHGEVISRTIIDEWGNPIGTISLYDIEKKCGFLGTWLGKPYHGKGYNQLAKEAFFQELFFENEIDTIYLRIRSENIRSQKATEKLPYVVKANETKPETYKKINDNPLGIQYELYEVSKDAYTLYYKTHFVHTNETIQTLDA